MNDAGMRIEVPKSVSSIFPGFLAVIFAGGAGDAGTMVREEVGRAENVTMEASAKGCQTPEGSHDRAGCSHLSLWHRSRGLVELRAQHGQAAHV